jgi:hypothetical protein
MQRNSPFSFSSHQSPNNNLANPKEMKMTMIMGSRHTNQVKTQTALQNNVRQMSRILSSSLLVFIEDNQ